MKEVYHPQLAEQGLSIFDFNQKRYRDVQAQWQPVMDALMPKVASKYEEVLADSTIPATLEKLANSSNEQENTMKKAGDGSTWYE